MDITRLGICIQISIVLKKIHESSAVKLCGRRFEILTIETASAETLSAENIRAEPLSVDTIRAEALCPEAGWQLAVWIFWG